MAKSSFDPVHRRLFVAVALLVLFIVAGSAVPASAQSLGDLRKSGVVGERYDGIAVLRQQTPAAAKIVARVNAKRTQIYAERARQQGVSADAVGRIYARKILQRAPPGTWFLGEDGRWVQKK